ncbi:MAG: hypothetical protein ACKVP3_09325 [Hyphomicrobiaceae bacterium]
MSAKVATVASAIIDRIGFLPCHANINRDTSAAMTTKWRRLEQVVISPIRTTNARTRQTISFLASQELRNTAKANDWAASQ